MGIYVFNWRKLRDYLTDDERDPKSQNDFGKNVLPAMLAAGERMFAYRFEGYWKDVGTIDSLWEANMDLLNPKIPLDLSDSEWKIYSRNPGLPPHYIGDTAKVENSMISEGGNIYGKVDFSVLFSGVTVEEGAEIRDSIIMPGSRICRGAVVQYAIVAENAVIGEGRWSAPVLKRWRISRTGVSRWSPPASTWARECVVPAKAMIDTDMEKAGVLHA